MVVGVGQLAVEGQVRLFLKVLAAILERAAVLLHHLLATAFHYSPVLTVCLYISHVLLWCSACTLPILFSRAAICRCCSPTCLIPKLPRFRPPAGRSPASPTAGNRRPPLPRAPAHFYPHQVAPPTSCIFTAQS